MKKSEVANFYEATKAKPQTKLILLDPWAQVRCLRGLAAQNRPDTFIFRKFEDVHQSETPNSQSEENAQHDDGPFDTMEGIKVKDDNTNKKPRVPSLISAYNQQYQQFK